MIYDNHHPQLEDFYRSYIGHRNTAVFLKQVSEKYTQPTLLRLAISGSVGTRRGVLTALTFIGDYEANDTFGRLLYDQDFGVRSLAEYGIKNIWTRGGDETQRSKLCEIMRLIAAADYDEAIRAANVMVEEVPDFAEVRNQRCIALFATKQYEDAIADGIEVMLINKYHFGAAIGVAHAYQFLGDLTRAYSSYKRALSINPNLDNAKRQMLKLSKMLD
ncbi:MAG: tetratricopeptide repeat protein [Planctomycetaceae bacterium]|jgi:tetratricopeptide (TPR) repeat protein|nr:tetratricopeptide repeat protein [Planctomycetaceae bacterium]